MGCIAASIVFTGLFVPDPHSAHLVMEVTEGNIVQLATYLQQTLSPDAGVRKPAEDFLKSVEVNQNYPVLLLSLLSREDGDINIKVGFLRAQKDNDL